VPGASNRRGWIATAVGLALAGLLLVGCGGSDTTKLPLDTPDALVDGNALYDCLSDNGPAGIEGWEVTRHLRDDETSSLPSASFSPQVGAGLVEAKWGPLLKGVPETFRLHKYALGLSVLPDLRAASEVARSASASRGFQDRNVIVIREPAGGPFSRNPYPRISPKVGPVMKECLAKALTARPVNERGRFVSCKARVSVDDLRVRNGDCAAIVRHLREIPLNGGPADYLKPHFPPGFVAVAPHFGNSPINSYYLGNGRTELVYRWGP
jgi:hypothetical protein